MEYLYKLSHFTGDNERNNENPSQDSRYPSQGSHIALWVGLGIITWVSYGNKRTDPCTDRFNTVTTIGHPTDRRLGEPLRRLSRWNGKKVPALAGN